jgi:Ca2+-binding EF-hand superfamily protein
MVFKKSGHYFITVISLLLVHATQNQALAEAPLAQNSIYTNIPEPLRRDICEPFYEKEQEYVNDILKYIQHGHIPNVLDQEYIDTLNIQRISGQVSVILQADLNNDGKVTKEEVLKTVQQRVKENGGFISAKHGGDKSDFEMQLDMYMRHDRNNDGVIDYDEMRRVDTGMQSDPVKRLRALLMLAPDKNYLLRKI